MKVNRNDMAAGSVSDMAPLAAALIIGGVLCFVFVITVINFIPSVAFGVTQAQANNTTNFTGDNTTKFHLDLASSVVLGTFPLLLLVIGVVGVVAFVFVVLSWMK